MEIPDCYFGFCNLSRMLHAKFDHIMSRIRQKSKKESCSYMSLEYAYEISAQLDQCNFIYGEDSTNRLISDSLHCVNYFVEIEDYFGKVVNMKVVEGLLIYFLLNFHMIWIKYLGLMHAKRSVSCFQKLK